MITKMPQRAVSWGLLAVGVGLCWGCAYAPEQKYEERYRLFFAKQLPVEAKITDSAQDLAAKFEPAVGVERSIQAFAEDGFQIAKIEPIEWGEGATIFTFRRNRGDELSPARAQIRHVGVFRVEDDQPEPTFYYVLSQGEDNYVLNIKRPDGIETHKAMWDGRQLVWDTEAGRNNGRMSPDGMTFSHLIENPTGFDLPRERTILRAQRVVPRQEPDSPEQREARRFVVRLKPQTPRYYDPFPW